MPTNKTSKKTASVTKKPAQRTASNAITKSSGNQLRARKDGRVKKFALV